jgi:hypothetical protein
VKNAEDEGEEEWLAVEIAKAGGELLSIVHLQNKWRMQKMKEKGKGKKNSSGWRWKLRRLVVSCSPLFTCKVNSGGECRRRRRRGRGRGKTVAGGGGRWLKGAALH